MAVSRTSRRLMRKAVSATLSRERFSTGGSLVVAVAGAIIAIRCISYPALILAQYPDTSAVLYFATCASSIAAAWAATLAFSLDRLRARTSVQLFFQGSVSSRRIQRIWSLQVAVLRFGTIGFLGYVPALLIAEATRTPGFPWSLLSMTAGAFVAAVGTLWAFDRLTRHTRTETSGLSDTVALVVVVLALAGPEFRIVDGTVVPLVFGAPIANGALGPVTPVVAALALPIHVLAARVPIPRPGSLSGLRSRFPLLSVYLRRRSLGHWLVFAILSAALSPLLRPLAVAALLSIVGTTGWITQSRRYLTSMRSYCIRNGRLTAIGREITNVAALSFALYFTVAIVVSALV